MIREIKFKKKYSKLNKLFGGNRKYLKKNNKNKKTHKKIDDKSKLKSKDNKVMLDNKVIQDGGNNKKEQFEITTLDNVDTSKFNVSRYVNANIDWGIMPGPPPTDCCIM
jgi:hypothetical protein